MDGILETALDGTTVQLIPGGAAFLPDESILLVADLHLGREASLQRSGIALPNGATQRTLDRLQQITQSLKPKKVLILGDLIHARCSISQGVANGICNYLESVTPCKVELIEGNHDRGSRNRLHNLGLTITTGVKKLGQLRFVHDLQSIECPATEVNSAKARTIHFCGHIHPGIRLPGENTRWPCFVMNTESLLLPAFGELTGRYLIEPQIHQRIFVTTGNSVLQVPT